MINDTSILVILCIHTGAIWVCMLLLYVIWKRSSYNFNDTWQIKSRMGLNPLVPVPSIKSEAPPIRSEPDMSYTLLFALGFKLKTTYAHGDDETPDKYITETYTRGPISIDIDYINNELHDWDMLINHTDEATQITIRDLKELVAIFHRNNIY